MRHAPDVSKGALGGGRSPGRGGGELRKILSVKICFKQILICALPYWTGRGARGAWEGPAVSRKWRAEIGTGWTGAVDPLARGWTAWPSPCCATSVTRHADQTVPRDATCHGRADQPLSRERSRHVRADQPPSRERPRHVRADQPPSRRQRRPGPRGPTPPRRGRRAGATGPRGSAARRGAMAQRPGGRQARARGVARWTRRSVAVREGWAGCPKVVRGGARRAGRVPRGGGRGFDRRPAGPGSPARRGDARPAGTRLRTSSDGRVLQRASRPGALATVDEDETSSGLGGILADEEHGDG